MSFPAKCPISYARGHLSDASKWPLSRMRAYSGVASPCFSLIVFLSLILLLGEELFAQVASQHSVTMDSILEAHQKRVERIRSLRFTLLGDSLRRKDSIRSGWPAEDAKSSMSFSAIYQGDAVYTIAIFDSWTGGVSPRMKRDNVAISAFNNGSWKTYEPYNQVGRIRDDASPPESQGSFVIAQLRQTLMDPEPALLTKLFGEHGGRIDVIRTERQDDDGVLVVVGTVDFNALKTVGGPVRAEFYLDPVQDYLLVRSVTMFPNGQLSSEAHYRYATNENGFYIPSKIISRSMSKDGISIDYLTNWTVQGVSLNEAIDDSSFNIEFPNGTRVTDYRVADRTKRTYVVGEAALGLTTAEAIARGDKWTSNTLAQFNEIGALNEAPIHQSFLRDAVSDDIPLDSRQFVPSRSLRDREWLVIGAALLVLVGAFFVGRRSWR